MTEFLPRYLRNRFWSFIANPDEPPGLKQLFDNLRNYTIVAILLAAGLLAAASSDYREIVAGWALIVLASLLLVLNGLQLWAWQLRAVHTWLGFSRHEMYGAGGDWRTYAKISLITLAPFALTAALWTLVGFLVDRASAP